MRDFSLAFTIDKEKPYSTQFRLLFQCFKEKQSNILIESSEKNENKLSKPEGSQLKRFMKGRSRINTGQALGSSEETLGKSSGREALISPPANEEQIP